VSGRQAHKDLGCLARSGVLRAAINLGNRALVQQCGDEIRGVSPALARRLAGEINAKLEPVLYRGAGRVFEDTTLDVWDIGFLAIDPKRAERVSFTRPYTTIDTTFAVRAEAAVQAVEAVDRAGVSVLTANGSAYDLHLTKTLSYATLTRLGTPPDSFDAFRNGLGDAVAGVRASLELAFAGDPNIRILPGTLTQVHQAIVLPGPDHPLLPALDRFVARAIAEGFIDRVLKDGAP